MKNGLKGEKKIQICMFFLRKYKYVCLQICMFSSRLIIISMNTNIRTKKLIFFNNKVKYQLFSIALQKRLIGKGKYVLEP